MAEKCRASAPSWRADARRRVTCGRDVHEVLALPEAWEQWGDKHEAIVATWHTGDDGGSELRWGDQAEGAIPHADALAPKLADPGERVTAAVSEALTFAISAAADAEREAIAAWVEKSDPCPIETLVREIREGKHRAQG